MESMFALESLYILDEPAEYTATYEELLEQASALESFADSLEDELFVYSAMEAASDDDIDTTASEISAKYRSGFEKIKKGKRTKNQKLISEGQREVNEASDDLKEAEKNADTAEKKAKLRKVTKIAIAVGGAVLLALLAYVGIKNRSKIVDAIRKLKKNPGSNVTQTVSEVKNAASTAAATPVEEKPVAPVSDGEQSVHQQLSDVKQRVGKSISDRHEAAQKEIDAALKEIYSEPTPSKDSGRPSKKMVEIDKKLDELLIDSDTKPTPTASIKPREKTERQITADKIRADRAHKKELKDWKISEIYNENSYSSRKPSKDEYDSLPKDLKDKAKRTGRFSFSTSYGQKDQYSADREKAGYYGYDSTFKYEKLLQNLYKYGARNTSDEVKKRHQLMHTWLKRDADKLIKLSKTKIDKMDRGELRETAALIDKVLKLAKEEREDKRFSTEGEFDWVDDARTKLHPITDWIFDALDKAKK